LTRLAGQPAAHARRLCAHTDHAQIIDLVADQPPGKASFRCVHDTTGEGASHDLVPFRKTGGNFVLGHPERERIHHMVFPP
jgi:hypothetical protein